MQMKISVLLAVVTLLSLATPGLPAPVASKILRVATATEPIDLDPQDFSESTAQSIISLVHNKLFVLDRQLNPVPELAESYKSSPDRLTWTLKLKRGIKFHDGTPLTAQAVKAIVDKTVGDKPPIRASFVGRPDLESARLVDDYTVEIKTKNPLGAFQRMMAGPAWAINSPAAYERYRERATKNPVGTGPYRFVQWSPGELIELERNPDYWGPPVYYDRIVFQFVREPATRVALLTTGQVDLITNVPPTDMPRLSRMANLTVNTIDLNRNIFIAINAQRLYLSDKRVRQAMNLAVDKQAIIKGVLQGLGIEATSPIPRLTWGHAGVGQYAYDVAKARQMLAEAGVPKGHRVKFWVPQGRYFQDKAIGEAVNNYLKELGLDMDFQVMEYGTYIASIRKVRAEAQHDLYLLGWAATNLDADLALTSVFHSSEWPLRGSNRGFYANPRVDQLIDQGRRTVNPELRKRVYAEAQRLIWDDAPWIFLHEMKDVVAHRRQIAGVFVWPHETLDLTQARE